MASAYTDMKKTKLIGNIIQESKIHHNISMSWNKMPDYSEEDLKAGFDWQDEAQFMIDDFVEEWEERPENDCGNRNLCGCNSEKNKNHKPENIKKDGACKVHDLWHIYSYGRMGATLYWDKYWKGKNSGFGFKYDADELEEKNIEELKRMGKEIQAYNRAIRGLMEAFYNQCAHRLEEVRENKKTEEKREALYQKTKKVVQDEGFMKLLITDIL